MSESVFHEGELRVQSRAGVQEQIAPIGAMNIRSEMPEQHRTFFSQLPFVVLGGVDGQGRPWATLCVGEPGFLSSPDASTLLIHAKPALLEELGICFDSDAHIGLLGIELGTRRRNRVNGLIKQVCDYHYTLSVQQSFGNCPQYIQRRDLSLELAANTISAHKTLHRLSHLDTDSAAIIRGADTFFIASRSASTTHARHDGTDVSHRGGIPGFVAVDKTSGCLSIPDFSGNRFFNTLGNIELDARVGLMFLDFKNGDALFVTGRASIDWNADRVSGFQGAERIIDVLPDIVVRAQHLFSITSSPPEPSPYLSQTGNWSESAYQPMDIVYRERESASTVSLYLKPRNQSPPADYLAGQFLPLKVRLADHDTVFFRAYSISRGPTHSHNDQTYRLTIRHKPDGRVSGALNTYDLDRIQLWAAQPQGKFVLLNHQAPIVLISAGVGITPMIAMLDSIVAGVASGSDPVPVLFVHSTQNSQSLLFGDALQTLEKEHPWLTLRISFTQAGAEDKRHPLNHRQHRPDARFVAGLITDSEASFYLCGPTTFIVDLRDGLVKQGIPDDRIFYELFNDDVIDIESVESHNLELPESADVRFANSGITSRWMSSTQTLLELAEDHGLTPAFSCRSGRCGMCSTRILAGQVQYTRVLVAIPDAGHALICCSVPFGDEPLVLDA